MSPEVQVTAERGPTSCPYCKDDLDPADELHRCAGCQALQHLDCREELGRCATCGATDALPPREAVEAPAPRAPAPTPPWTGQLGDPPGRRIRIERTLEEVRASWGNESGKTMAVVVATMVLCLPALPFLMLLAIQRGRGEARFGRDELELLVEGPLGFPRRRRFSRAVVRGARLSFAYPSSWAGRPSPVELETSEGNHRLVTGVLFAALDPDELRWLTRSIQRWSVPGQPPIPVGQSSARERRRRRKRRKNRRRR